MKKEKLPRVEFDDDVLSIMANGLIEDRTVCPISGKPKNTSHLTSGEFKEYAWLVKKKIVKLKIQLPDVIFQAAYEKARELYQDSVYRNIAYKAIVSYLVKILPEVKKVDGILPLAALEGAAHKARFEVLGSSDIEVNSPRQELPKREEKDEPAKIVKLPIEVESEEKPAKANDEAKIIETPDQWQIEAFEDTVVAIQVMLEEECSVRDIRSHSFVFESRAVSKFMVEKAIDQVKSTWKARAWKYACSRVSRICPDWVNIQFFVENGIRYEGRDLSGNMVKAACSHVINSRQFMKKGYVGEGSVKVIYRKDNDQNKRKEKKEKKVFHSNYLDSLNAGLVT